jgi:TolB-like protein
MPEQNAENELLFPELIIQDQIQKIFMHHPFKVSLILRDFLSYIVQETILGRAKDIKEYNIAVDVLKKPSDFKPGHSGLVRVHARRLRTALEVYYREHGSRDTCIISVPTGRYIPVFRKADASGRPFYPELKSVNHFQAKDQIKIAVMPFNSYEQHLHRLGFVDSIGMSLCHVMGSLPGISVFSYFAMQTVQSQYKTIQTLAAGYEVEYLLGGRVQFEDACIRVCFQLINTTTETQLYSDTICLDNDADHYFDLSDRVVSKMITALGKFCGWAGQPMIRNSGSNLPDKRTKGRKYAITENKMAKKATA